MEVDERRTWTLLTSHGHVLVEIARNPRARVRDISASAGITERATQAIIADLEQAGYVDRVRVGRRTHYVLHTDNPFRHSAQEGLRVGPFLELLTNVADPSIVPSAPAADPLPPAPSDV
jgi:predicted transcriptional regulator